MGIIGNTIDRIWDKFENWRHPKPTTEDKVDGAVDQIGRSIDELRMAVAQETATQGQLQIKVQQVDVAAGEWHEKAVKSMREGKEEAAKLALDEERTLRIQADSLRKQIEQSKERVTKDRRELKRLEQKAEDLKNRGQDVKDRDKVEDAKKKTGDELDPNNPNSGAGKIDQADKDTAAKEKARKDKEDANGTTIDNSFEDMKRRQELDEMMDRLRREAKGQGAPAPTPSAPSPAPAKSAVGPVGPILPTQEWFIAP